MLIPETQTHQQITLPDGTAFNMIFIQGGVFDMGDEHGDLWDACRPVHPVELSDFYLAEFPVTQALWRAVASSPAGLKYYPIEASPSKVTGDLHPAENVSWNDIVQKFLPALREWTGRSGFRLPTEAEWEYAARGGIYWKEGYLYSGSDKLSEVAWFDRNSGDRTREVGLLYPNPLNLYDMSGNVWEWCADAWDEKTFQKCREEGSVKDPHADQGAYRVIRGGSFFSYDQRCRSAGRYDREPAIRPDGIGFRLALQ